MKYFLFVTMAMTSLVSQGQTQTLLPAAEAGATLSPNAKIFITNVTLIDVEKQKLIANATVGITGSSITSISIRSKTPLPADATIIDGAGKFLMPGLWDMHGHYSKESGSFYLAGGVTHIRDMGNDKFLLTFRKQIAENKLLGP